MVIFRKLGAGARALYESVGFQVFGREPRELKFEGKYYDSLHMWLDIRGTGHA